MHVLSMPPAFALSQDQTLRFIHHQIHERTQQLQNNPALNLSPTSSQPSQDNQTPSQDITQGTRTSQPQHPSADRASHPSHQQHHTRHHQHNRHNPQPSLSPAPSHPKLGQPRTKHFQNRYDCQRTKPDQPEITSGEATKHQSRKTPLSQRADDTTDIPATRQPPASAA